MADVDRRLQYAGIPYFDRTPSVGVTSVPGLTLDYLPFADTQDLFRRQAQAAEFEAAEMSLSTYIMLLSRGDTRFVGVPVFPSRAFRHGSLFVAADSDISSPDALRGARVGVPEYQMTAAVWVRGLLSDEHGIEPEDVEWSTGGLDKPGYVPRFSTALPEGVRLAVIPEDQTLASMLGEGKLDAVMTVVPPQDGGHRFRPLFADPVAAERDYYRRTGIFPIMHLVVLRRDRYEQDPSIAAALAELLKVAKEAGRQRMRRLDCLAVALPWLNASVAEDDADFGGDPFPDGMEPNARVLEKLADYSHRQGLSARKVEVSELFAPEAVEVLG